MKKHFLLAIGVAVTPFLVYLVFTPEPTGKSQLPLYFLFPFSSLLFVFQDIFDSQKFLLFYSGVLIGLVQFPGYGMYIDKQRMSERLVKGLMYVIGLHGFVLLVVIVLAYVFRL